MIAAGILLFAVGLADLARQFLGRRSRRVRTVGSISAVVLVCAVASGVVAWPVVAIIAGVALAWLALMPSTKDAAIAGFWPALGLAIAVVILLLSATGSVDGWAAGWWATTSVAVPPLAKIVFATGVGSFLLESSNIIVRIALQSERAGALAAEAAPQPAAVATSPLRRLLSRLRRPAPTEPPSTTKQLRGGRLIGPLERLFVVGLIFTSAVALLAAFIAAKGIVRFPEIQKDSSKGTQAEYFLVGSMASWATALAAAGLLWVVGATPTGLGIS